MKTKHAMQPARRVVDRIGGCREIARLLDISPSTVSRWMTPVEARGTGGRIPQKYWGTLLTLSGRRKLKLTIKDLAGL